MYEPFISVVVPVYNREQLVAACIESILNQTYKNFELIIVDDGSTDKSYEICKKYQSADKRISIIKQKNSGVSIARNQGIENAKGEYICFVDSDDTVSPDILKSYTEQLQTKAYDLIVCGFYNATQNHKVEYYELPDREINNLKDFWNNFGNLLHINLLRSPVNKLYKKSILNENKIRFDANTQIGEDALFNKNYYFYINSIYVLNKPLYNVLLHNSSNRLSNQFHESFFETQNQLFRGYVDLLIKNNVFCEHNKYVLSCQYTDLLWKGFRDELNAKRKLSFYSVQKEIINELLPITEKEHYCFAKIGQAIISNNPNTIKLYSIYKCKAKMLWSIYHIKERKSIFQKLSFLCKYCVWFLLYIPEIIIRLPLRIKCEVV